MEREGIKIVSIDDTQGGKNIAEKFKFIREKKVGNIITGENFNVRIGELGGGSMEESDRKRHSKDKVVGNRGGGGGIHRMDKRERMVYFEWENRGRLGGVYVCRSQR